MKKGFAPFIILLVVGFVSLIGAIGYVAARNFTKLQEPRKFDTTSSNQSSGGSSLNETQIASPRAAASPLAVGSSQAPVSTSSASTASGGASTIYKQPQGKYSITLPSGWKFENTVATKTYSTTKFSGTGSSISITFGTGKDPAGGCSETSDVVLADRTISGCFLLQKDGSQILNRAYTKDSAGVEITVEGTFNSPNTTTRPTVLAIIKTIDIN